LSGDLQNTGATLSSGADMNLIVDGDATFTAKEIEKETEKDSGFAYNREYSKTNQMSQVSAGGNINVTSQKTISIEGANINSEASIELAAKENVVVKSVRDVYEKEDRWSMKSGGWFGVNASYDNSKSANVVQGSNVGAEGSIKISSGDTVDVRASTLGAGKNLQVQAGNKITIAGEQSAYSQTNSSRVKGFLKKDISRKHTSNNQYQGAMLIAGENLDIATDSDVQVTGSTLAAEGNVTVSGADVVLDTGTSTSSSSSYEKHAGLFAEGMDGGFGFSIGYRKTTDKANTDQTQAVGSSIGAGKNLTVAAQNNVNATAATLTAGNDISITAQEDITIQAGQNTFEQSQSHKQSQIAFSAGFKAPIINNVKALSENAQNATSGKGNAINQAVTAASSTLKAIDAAKNIATGSWVTAENGFELSTRKSSSQQQSTSAQQSIINAKNDVTLDAGSNLALVGSDISAEGDIKLVAGDDLNIEAAKQSASGSSKNSSSSIGIKLVTGYNPMTGGSMSLNMSAGGSSGNSEWQSQTHQNAAVSAGDKLTIKTGDDARIAGAKLTANEISATIDGALEVKS
ncbi:hemagglutinin repeat-containing protein, partial [Polycladidibacter hongkongensis]|uniref:hemagglutinin repeat-containing protein n=1 Tax=Polycladidibacter hongkongensis TaxID=1647556 RepID=UPI000A9C2813